MGPSSGMLRNQNDRPRAKIPPGSRCQYRTKTRQFDAKSSPQPLEDVDHGKKATLGQWPKTSLRQRVPPGISLSASATTLPDLWQEVREGRGLGIPLRPRTSRWNDDQSGAAELETPLKATDELEIVIETARKATR